MANPKKDEPIFVEPPFDKKGYLKYERERAKAIIFVFLIGLVVGILSAFFEIYGFWYLGVLLLIAILYFLNRIIKFLKIGLPKQTSHKIYMYGELIITWFIFWIIALNPPVHLISGPEIVNLQFENNNHWTNLTEVSGKYDIPFNGTTTDHLRYHTDYKYPINAIYINETTSGITRPVKYTESHNEVYFNLTSVSPGSTYYVHITEKSSYKSTSETFKFFITS